MFTWRLCREKYASSPLDGEGARRFGGRWNPAGHRVVYSSGSLALAALELLVHVDHEDTPDDLISIRIEIPDTLAQSTVSVDDLPANWRAHPAPTNLQERGRRWIDDGSSPVLGVPSAVVSSEYNYLINPLHGEARSITAHVEGAFLFDPRLFD